LAATNDDLTPPTAPLSATGQRELDPGRLDGIVQQRALLDLDGLVRV
jgi:hypothetical protein